MTCGPSSTRSRLQPLFVWDGRQRPLLRPVHLRSSKRTAGVHRGPVYRSLYVRHATGVSPGFAQEVRPGGIRRCGRSGSQRGAVQLQQPPTQHWDGLEVHAGQEVSRQSTRQRRRGQKRPNVEHGRRRRLLTRKAKLNLLGSAMRDTAVRTSKEGEAYLGDDGSGRRKDTRGPEVARWSWP